MYTIAKERRSDSWSVRRPSVIFGLVLVLAVVCPGPNGSGLRSTPSSPGTFGTPDLAFFVGPGDQLAPDLDMGFVAWEDWRSGTPEVWGLDVLTRIPTPMWPGDHAQRFPRIHGGILTFVDGPSYFECNVDGDSREFCIRFVDVRTGSTWSHLGNVSRYEVVSNRDSFAQLTNWAPTSPSALVVRSLQDGTATFAGIEAEHPGATSGMDSFDDDIALRLRPYQTSLPFPFRFANEMGVFFLANLTAMPLTRSLDRARQVDPQGNFFATCFSDFTREVAPRVSGTVVVWQDNRNSEFRFDPGNCGVAGERWDVYGFDLAAGVEFGVRTSAWNETHPDLDGDLLAWADDRNGNWDIYAMSLDGGTEYRLTDNPADQRNPVFSDGCLAWEDNRNGNWDIYGACNMRSLIRSSPEALVQPDRSLGGEPTAIPPEATHRDSPWPPPAANPSPGTMIIPGPPRPGGKTHR